jgi:hypothetical protein
VTSVSVYFSFRSPELWKEETINYGRRKTECLVLSARFCIFFFEKQDPFSLQLSYRWAKCTPNVQGTGSSGWALAFIHWEPGNISVKEHNARPCQCHHSGEARPGQPKPTAKGPGAFCRVRQERRSSVCPAGVQDCGVHVKDLVGAVWVLPRPVASH